jgi:hypothetical protein
MSLVKSIDRLINDITDSAIRNRLVALRKRAERVDLALEQCQANLEQSSSDLQRSRADFKRFKEDIKKEKLVSDKDAVEEIGKQILRILAKGLWPYLPAVAEIAEVLRIQKIKAEYHVDTFFFILPG